MRVGDSHAQHPYCRCRALATAVLLLPGDRVLLSQDSGSILVSIFMRKLGPLAKAVNSVWIQEESAGVQPATKYPKHNKELRNKTSRAGP